MSQSGHFLTMFTWFCLWIWGVHPYRQPQEASGQSWTIRLADILLFWKWHGCEKTYSPLALFSEYLWLHLTYMKTFYIFQLSMSWACWKCLYFLFWCTGRWEIEKNKVLHVLWTPCIIACHMGLNAAKYHRHFYSELQLCWKIIFPFLAKSCAHAHTLPYKVP